MNILTFVLSGPMAAYTTSPRFENRLTQYRPTNSAIIGMIANAMGLKRGETSPTLESVTIEVGEFSGGDIEQDFQTIRDAITYGGDGGRNVVTRRQYVPDYYAEVTITGDESAITEIKHALQYPKRALYLGRRANVLDRPPVGLFRQYALPQIKML